MVFVENYGHNEILDIEQFWLKREKHKLSRFHQRYQSNLSLGPTFSSSIYLNIKVLLFFVDSTSDGKKKLYIE